MGPIFSCLKYQKARRSFTFDRWSGPPPTGSQQQQTRNGCHCTWWRPDEAVQYRIRCNPRSSRSNPLKGFFSAQHRSCAANTTDSADGEDANIPNHFGPTEIALLPNLLLLRLNKTANGGEMSPLFVHVVAKVQPGRILKGLKRIWS